MSQRYQAAPEALAKAAAAQKAKAGRRDLRKRGRLGAWCSTLHSRLGPNLGREVTGGYGSLREFTGYSDSSLRYSDSTQMLWFEILLA